MIGPETEGRSLLESMGVPWACEITKLRMPSAGCAEAAFRPAPAPPEPRPGCCCLGEPDATPEASPLISGPPSDLASGPASGLVLGRASGLGSGLVSGLGSGLGSSRVAVGAWS